MKKLLAGIAVFYFIVISISLSLDVLVKNDNGTPAGNAWVAGRDTWEESTILTPDGPCRIKKIRIYYQGTRPTKDTLWIVNFPTAGGDQGWKTTHFVWPYNTLIDPVVVDYDGTPGWKDIDVSGTDLRSDGFDKIVIQHYLKANGPWFAFDSDGLTGQNSWLNNSWVTPWGASYSYPNGDYMVQFIVEYIFPDGNTSQLPPAPLFTDVTDIAGITRPTTDAQAVDWNNDDLDDLVLGGIMYKNNGNGTFSDVSVQFGNFGGNTMWGDIDNDGNLDVYVLRNGEQDITNAYTKNRDAVYLYRNGQYIQQPVKDVFLLPYPSPNQEMLGIAGIQDTMQNPYNTCTPMWLDYDGDGSLDLFIANRRLEMNGKEAYFPDQLWKNNGAGKLANVRNSAKITGEQFTPRNPNDPNQYGFGYYDCYGAVACDYNKDNKTDIFVANYRLAPDNLYSNSGNGTFTDVGASTGVQGEATVVPYYFGHGMGCEWGDFNNDAYPDLMVGNLGHPNMQGWYSNSSLIYENQGPPSYNFRNVKKRMELKFHEGNAGVVWFDFDLDGLLDVWHGKYSGGMGSFYLNQGPPDYKLKEITWDLNCVIQSPWSAVRLDYDRDGDMDMVIKGRLYRNDIPHKGNFLSIRLKGDTSAKVNTSALGSKVTVYAGNKKFYRDLMGSSSGTHCNQNSYEMNFGLGNVVKPDSVVVIYNNGKSKTYTTLNVNQHYIIPYLGTEKLSCVTTPALISPKNMTYHHNPDIILNWSNCGNEVIYQCEITDELPFFPKAVYTSLDTTTATFKNLTFNKTYYWRVKAKKGNESSIYSSIWSFTVNLPMPDAPVLIAPKNDSLNITTTPVLSWSQSAYHGAYVSKTYYQLQIATDTGFISVVLDTVTNGLNYFCINPLNSSAKFYWRVRGKCDTLPGNWSQVWNFTTIGIPQKIALKQPANGETGVKVRPRLYWDVSPAAESYKYQISSDNQFKVIYAEGEILGTNVLVLKMLEQGTEYFWHVRGFNIAGEGEWSDTWRFTTEGTKNVPEIIPVILIDNLNLRPNPFSEKLELSFELRQGGLVEIDILNILGDAQKIFSGILPEGKNLIEWKPLNLVPGFYVIRLTASKHRISEGVIFIP